MPSFAKKELPDMTDVFKHHPSPDILQDLLIEARQKATEHIQKTIPAKIAHIRSIIATESDSSSALWPGHIDTAPFTQPKMTQPTIGSGRVMPSDVSGTLKGWDEEEEVEMKSEKTAVNGILEKGTSGVGNGSVGPHWFEVLEPNTVMEELIRIALKEFEDLTLIVQDLRGWIELEIPVIEDGNSFGADVQGLVKNSMFDWYKGAYNFQTACRIHHADRGKLGLLLAKFPNFQDYKAAITLNDRSDHVIIRAYLRSLLITYGGMLTRLERNWAKVTNPKGSGAGNGGMY